MRYAMTLILFLASVILLQAKTDELRSAYANTVKKQLSPPVKYGNVTLTDVFHVKELDTLAYVYIGKPDYKAIATNANSFWRGSGGLEMRKYGFRDAIYGFGDGDKEYGVYSCAEKKWYSGITAFCKAKGLPTG